MPDDHKLLLEIRDSLLRQEARAEAEAHPNAEMNRLLRRAALVAKAEIAGFPVGPSEADPAAPGWPPVEVIKWKRTELEAAGQDAGYDTLAEALLTTPQTIRRRLGVLKENDTPTPLATPLLHRQGSDSARGQVARDERGPDPAAEGRSPEEVLDLTEPAVTKRCAVCKVTKSTTAFFSSSLTRDGLYPRCRSCNRAIMSSWRAANPEKARAAYLRAKHARRARLRASSGLTRAA